MIFDQQDRFVRGFEDQKAPTIYPTSSGQELSIPHGQIHLDMPLGMCLSHLPWILGVQFWNISHAHMSCQLDSDLPFGSDVVLLEETSCNPWGIPEKVQHPWGFYSKRQSRFGGPDPPLTHPRVPNDGCVQVKLAHRTMQDLNWGLLLSSQWCCVVSTDQKMELGPTSHEEKLFASHSVWSKVSNKCKESLSTLQ